jgi:dienelactone hydrolase
MHKARQAIHGQEEDPMNVRHLISGIVAGLATSLGVMEPVFAQQDAVPFAQQKITFANGVTGQVFQFESATPGSFSVAVAMENLTKVTLDGQLFLPKAQGRLPLVIIAPGSEGVSPPMLRHAEILTEAGIGVFIIDPFSGRGIKDTVADQSRLSFAASAFDVLMAANAFFAHDAVDRARVGAMGYSRGGLAVLMAATEQMAMPALGRESALKAVLAGWPWCGFQFQRAAATQTAIRMVVAGSDNWVSPVQCQGQAAALRAAQARVSIRLVKDAAHGFGYGLSMREIPDAVHSRHAPVVYLDDKGVVLDVYSGEPTTGPAVGKMIQPWLGKGVSAGAQPGQMEDFIADMVAFFRREL